jgi:hypothetical protein
MMMFGGKGKYEVSRTSQHGLVQMRYSTRYNILLVMTTLMYNYLGYSLQQSESDPSWYSYDTMYKFPAAQPCY